MEESKNYEECHQHPLILLLNEEQLISSNRSGVLRKCSRCGEEVSAPCLSCLEEDCAGFYLHKVCADAPLKLDHPFHPHHPLVLLQNAPYSWICDFCDKVGEKFVYHCSCGLDFHIKCALFTFDIAGNNLKELEHVALIDPLIISTKNVDAKLEDVAKCFGCWEPLANYTYFSLDCGFNLHKKCAELPLNMNHMCHRKHPLVLQFNSERLSCKICEVNRRRGFIYVCSPCKFVVHIECVLASPDLVIEDKSHPHPFTLFLRRVPFICDACGTEGIYDAYICSICNIIVHKNCTSLPPIIKSKWHDHRIFHKYFLPDDFKTSDCIICHDEVKSGHGSYCCSDCHVTVHVRCVTEDKDSYYIVSPEDEDEIPYESSITILETNDAGEATKVKHFKHIHDLLLSPLVGGYGNNCDGCMLPISDPFYYCSQCDFILHKACAELPKMKDVWHHSCQQSLTLISDRIFRCEVCDHLSNAFAYKCGGCYDTTCLRCVIALTPGARTSSKHEHPLFFYRDKGGECNACGDTEYVTFRCKDCSFVVDHRCFSLPITSRHKCDEHSFSLTYHDDNNYAETHFCDICEEDRDPYPWFYHCAACDTSAHVKCVLGEYPFIKLGSIYKKEEEVHEDPFIELGSIYKEEEEKVHEHPLTFVKKIYYYPDCSECGKPCVDLSVECTQSGCNFIRHFGGCPE